MNSKQKGNRVERDICKILSEKFNDIFKRVPQSGAVMGGSNYDSDLRDDVIEILSGDIICPKNFKYSVEVKSRKQFNFFDFFNEKAEFHNWIKQTQDDAKKSKKKAMLVIKINNHKPFFMLSEFSEYYFDLDYSDALRFEGFCFFSYDDFLLLDNDIFFD